MPANSMSKLTIQSLRGVRQPLEIPFERKMCLIYGENGSGKTSICDALDFLGNGAIGSVVDIGLGTAVHKYWPFLGSNHADIAVTLENKNGTKWVATSSGNSVIVSPEAGKPIVKIWRRSQLFKLLLETAANRYEVIKPFIDISKIENSESMLRKAKNDANRALTDASLKLEQNRETIRNSMELMGGQGGDEILWARAELDKPELELDQEIKYLDQAIELLRKIIAELTEHNTLLTTISEQSETKNTAQDQLNSVIGTLSANAEDTLTILEASKLYFLNNADVEECPLCESKENINGLPEKVESAIESYTALTEARDSLSKVDTALERLQTRHATLSQALDGNIQDLIKHLSDADNLDMVNDLLKNINLDIAETESVISSLGDERKDLDNAKSSLSTIQANRNSLKFAVSQFDTNFEQQSENQRLVPILEKLLDIHDSERKAYVGQILDGISGEVGRLYEEIHPGEGLNKISLKLKSAGKSSLGIESEFLGTVVQPSAYFSNSHIDSLGLCILIALAKLEGPENTVLVMDDILGSIDEPHFDRMVQLIYAESVHFLQTIVTTHYHAWHHKIRRGQLRNADCSLVELRQWNEQTGASIQASARPLVEILRDNLLNNPGEIEPIASNAGHLLEQIGDFITLRYECSVPRRNGGNTLNDYLGALKSKLTKHIYVELISDDGSVANTIQVEPIIEELKDIYLVRNSTGAHYTTLASHLPPQDVCRFGELVLELCDAFICAENGLPTKLRNGAYWSPPTKETRRQFPALKP